MMKAIYLAEHSPDLITVRIKYSFRGIDTDFSKKFQTRPLSYEVFDAIILRCFVFKHFPVEAITSASWEDSVDPEISHSFTQFFLDNMDEKIHDYTELIFPGTTGESDFQYDHE